MSVHQAHETLWIDADPLSTALDVPVGETAAHSSLSKRVLDLAIAVPLLLLLAPLMAAVALWIALDSKGPVFFRQTRRGLGGKRFDIVKFRSMTVLENGDSVVQAKENDPRVTHAGRFLRKSSLDELPQLLNVIRGEMSLVGPRPHALAHDEFYGAAIEGYAARQGVKPGITGWAQVHGLRGETPTLDSMKRRVVFDTWYARNAGLILDLEILLRTPFEVLRRRNAH
ncbi:MAG TPA: exopolysaccharide biosynthesis polyprenyl glycosylphosphotransferase [Rhizomicrobium sp.]